MKLKKHVTSYAAILKSKAQLKVYLQVYEFSIHNEMTAVKKTSSSRTKHE